MKYQERNAFANDKPPYGQGTVEKGDDRIEKSLRIR
jgi:hypothetical protein